MKIVKNFILVCFITLINISSVLAKQAPPEPLANGRASALPPEPPGAPIDQNLIVLTLAALLFGIYSIYRYNLNKKASM